jgi:hypothetical protein
VTINSVGEGTGSGHYSTISEHLQVHYSKVTKINFVGTPSQALGGTIVEPYNAVCAFDAMLRGHDLNVLFENEALIGIAKRKLKLERPGFKEINRLMA